MSDELGELEDLSTPILELAAGYGRAGLRVFPVDMRPDARGKPRKAPLHGYLWKERATSKITEIVEDVLEAIERIGEANVGIGWALGLDGCLALDLDGDEPSWWTDLLPADVAVNVTARGLHLIYRQPDGRRIGNGTAGFPSRGWGEVRGHGGYVVVAGPDRPGFDVAQLERVVPFPRPEWLSDAGAEAIELDDAELEAWLAERSDAVSVPGKIAGYRTRLERWRAPESRHDTALEVACWMMREAAADLVNAVEALDVLGAWWLEVGRLPGRKLTLRELASVIRWAVGVAIADPERVAEIRGRELYLEVDLAELVTVDVDAVPSARRRRPPDPSFVPEDPAPVVAGTEERITPDLLRLDDGRALLYRDRLNGVHGDSGTGKSWLLALGVREELEAERSVVVIDVEDRLRLLVDRLRQIGTSDEAMISGLVFVHPSAPWDVENVDALVDATIERRAAHVFLDSLGEAFGLDGIDENSDAEVTPWISKVVRRILDETGAGVTLLDHVTKAGDNPLHPSGSKRKRAAITGSSWLLRSLEPITYETGGRVAVRCAKDRVGHYRSDVTVAHLVMSPIDPTTKRSTLELTAVGTEPWREERRASAMQHVVTYLGGHAGAHSMRAVAAGIREAGVRINDDVIRGALELAAERGFAVETKGPHKARMFAWLRDIE